MEIVYKIDPTISTEQIADVFDRSTIRRPTGDLERIAKMAAAADLTICAYAGDLLVGYARSLTDFCFCCYLSDLAVDVNYQRQGIGKCLVDKTREIIGPETALILLAAPAAMDYYPKIGFTKADNAYVIKRTK